MNGIIIQARMGSSRLPGKVMKKLEGKEVLWHVVQRCRKSKLANKVIIATSTNLSDAIIYNFCRKNKIDVFRGDLNNVLSRYYHCAKEYGIDTVARITSDCPLIDPYIIDEYIKRFKRHRCDFISNIIAGKTTFPLGLSVEVFSFRALEIAYNDSEQQYEKEHVTPNIYENKKNKFILGNLVSAPPEYDKPQHRLTLDYPEDLTLMKKIYKKFYSPKKIINTSAVLIYLDKNPAVSKINANLTQKSYKSS